MYGWDWVLGNTVPGNTVPVSYRQSCACAVNTAWTKLKALSWYGGIAGEAGRRGMADWHSSRSLPCAPRSRCGGHQLWTLVVTERSSFVPSQELFDRLETAAAAGPPRSNSSSELGSCAPHLMLFIELVADPHLLALMPTNVLRNAAMLAVRTPLSLMLDADLSLSPLLGALVQGKHPDRWGDLERETTVGACLGRGVLCCEHARLALKHAHCSLGKLPSPSKLAKPTNCHLEKHTVHAGTYSPFVGATPILSYHVL